MLWGSNMAEMHPIPVVAPDRPSPDRNTSRCIGAVDFTHRSCELADNELIFKPQSDLAILNYIANYIIQNGAELTRTFVCQPRQFRKGVTDIGYGLRPDHPLEKVAMNNGYPGADGKPKGNPSASAPNDLSMSLRPLFPSTPLKSIQISGVPKASWRRWPKPTPIRRPRSPPAGPWASTSTPVAPG